MALSLSFDAAKPLTEEELKVYRAAVLKWAGTVCRMDGRTLDGLLQVSQGALIPVYDLTLQTLLETRELQPEPSVLPASEGLTPVKKPLSKEEINLWDIPSAPPEEFKNDRTTAVIPSTVTEKDCAACAKEEQKGYILCPTCDGKGRSPCENCRGRGKLPCDTCHGMGKLNCMRCNGRGLKESSNLRVSLSDACPDCKGDGKMVCARCKRGEVDCRMCEGAGKKPCDLCKTEGKTFCSTCQGKAKFLTGFSYAVEYKNQLSSAMAGVEPVSMSVMSEIFSLKTQSRSSHALAGPLTEEEVNQSSAPAPIKALLAQQLQKLKPLVSAKTRVAKQQISLVKDEVVCLKGSFDGQELLCWIQPKTQKVYAEKNPFKNLVEAIWHDAQLKKEAGAWPEAMALARKVLSYDAGHIGAKGLFQEWRMKLLRDNLAASLAAGVLMAVVAGGFILFVEKGIHKASPAFKASLVLLSLGTVLGAAWFPITRTLPKALLRLGVSFGLTLVALGAFASVVRSVFKWNGVLEADQKAYQSELSERFPRGINKEVFWPEDLLAMEELEGKYKDTQVDLKPVQDGIAAQRRLKKEKEQLAQRFKAELAQILGSNMRIQEKISQLRQLRDFYKLNSIDVSAAEEPLKKLEADYKARPEKPKSRVFMEKVSPTKKTPPKSGKELKREQKKKEKELKKKQKEEKKKPQEKSKKTG